jgi:hypothetical protein
MREMFALTTRSGEMLAPGTAICAICHADPAYRSQLYTKARQELIDETIGDFVECPPDVAKHLTCQVCCYNAKGEGFGPTGDLHTETAKQVFRTDEPNAEQRAFAKRLNYAKAYGATPRRRVKTPLRQLAESLSEMALRMEDMMSDVREIDPEDVLDEIHHDIQGLVADIQNILDQRYI